MRERDGAAAYNYLIDSMGFDSGNIHVASQTSLETADFTGYNLVIYANSFARSTANVISQNMPYITTSLWQTAELGIATGEWLMHESRNSVFIQDTTHDITSGFAYGQLVLQDQMWMDAVFVSGNGVALVTADEGLYFRPLSVKTDHPRGTVITQESTFPTPFGAPGECLTGGTVPAIRRINYQNGGIEVSGCPPIPIKGDVNLNGLSYEIADAVLFADFFLYGLDVFQTDLDKQIEATEVNNDDTPLTLDDYVYIWRVIIGDANPLPSPPMPGDTVLFFQDTVSKTVSLSYTGSLRAVYLVFEGDLIPWGWSDSTRPFDGQFTRVLMDVFSFQDSTIFSQDSLFYYTGEGVLVGACASFDGLVPLPTAIIGGVNSCFISRGNVDGDSEGSVDIVDLTELVAYVYGNGPVPSCLIEADISGDFSIDLLDMVFFVDYLFQSGPPPHDCP